MVEVKAAGDNQKLVDYVNNILTPINAQRGDALPVSAFKDLSLIHIFLST